MLAILASHPKTLEKFFEVSVFCGKDGVDHLVIDGSDGICDVQQLRLFLVDCLSYALTSTVWCTQRKAEEEAKAKRRLQTETGLLVPRAPPASGARPMRRASY